MYYSFKENDALNDYVLQNNKLEKFTWVRSQMGNTFNIVYDNVDMDGKSLNFDKDSGKNYIIGMYNVGN
jgi:hypothetical protein